MHNRSSRRARKPLIATATGLALAASVLVTAPVASSAATHRAPTLRAAARLLEAKLAGRRGMRLQAADGPRAAREAVALPAGVPSSGNYAFLLRLDKRPSLVVYRQLALRGRTVARAAARQQASAIARAQDTAIRQLPSGSQVLYRTHVVLAGLAVVTDVHNYAALRGISGVTAVYPIAPKKPSTSYSMYLQRAPQAWAAHPGDFGKNSTIAIIDTGIDYTHADFGGPGTVAAYDAAHASPGGTATYPDPTKIVGGHDFAGDLYDPDQFLPDGSKNPNYHPRTNPDDNPIDCDGHGTHVAGIAAGYGENPDGSTFTGDYATLDTSSVANYQAQFRIGPGMAPKAKILSYKVFGCTGSTTLVGQAIDRAVSDHASVINMSLGSDFTSPEDGDAVLANQASKLGVTVVAASGNAGDQYDVGGSPGDASRVIAAANSADNFSEFDTLHVSFGATAQGPMGAERSADWDWLHKADLAGSVVQLTGSNNTACSPLSSADVAKVNGKIAFVEWNDANPTCPTNPNATPSTLRANHLAAAHASGFIFASNTNLLSTGISGNAKIPGVLLMKTGADAIRNQLTVPAPVTVTGTDAGGFSQLATGVDNTLEASSSRGIRGNGNVKPDVTAVGQTVFSAAIGSGNQGVSETGTSMASPMVAGLAALVRSLRPSWSPEQVKADIMNTAGQNLHVSRSNAQVYAPNRVGAGRIVVDAALDNKVLAYVRNDPGSVSVSFGPVQVSKAMTLTKTVKVVNKSGSAAAYTLGYHAVTAVPGVQYVVSPTTLNLGASGASATKTFTVTFKVSNRTRLTKTRDLTVAARTDVGGGEKLGNDTLADASGRVQLTPAAGNAAGARTALRVPVYAAPRPASTMSEATSLALPGSGVQKGSLELKGTGVLQGSGSARVKSVVSGFELQATSGRAPTCTANLTHNCVHFADERGADLKYVGSTSDYPVWKGLHDRTPFADTRAYIAITTQRPWRTPVGPQEFDVFLDTNRDGKADAIVYNTRLGTSDLFLSEMIDVRNADPSKWFIRDDQFLDDRLGNPSSFPTSQGTFTFPGLDTALYDSDTLMLPIWVGGMQRCTVATCGVSFPALPGFSSTHTRFNYGVATFGEAGVVDRVGVNPATMQLSSSHLSMDIKRPGVSVHNGTTKFEPTLGLSMSNDLPGATLSVRRDVAAYNRDHAKAMMLVHFQNRVGGKARLVTLRSKPRIAISLSATSTVLGNPISARVRVANTAGHAATGKVALHNGRGRVIKTRRLRNGRVTFTWTPGARGSFAVYATYAGDSHYAGGRSAKVSYRVT